MRWLCAFGLVIFGASNASAYADEPRSDLWSLAVKSEVIVVGTARPTGSADAGLISLDAEDVIKGKDVPSSPPFGRKDNAWLDFGWGDPFEAGDRPIAATRVLAFFKAREGSGGLWKLMPWGVVRLAPGEDEAFSSRIKSAILAQTRPTSNDVTQREWMLECAKDRATRGHCVGWFSARDLNNRPLRSLLTPAEKRELAAAFTNAPTVDASFLSVLLLVGDEKDPAFDQVALDTMERLLMTPSNVGPNKDKELWAAWMAAAAKSETVRRDRDRVAREQPLPPELWVGDAYPLLMERLAEPTLFPVFEGRARPRVTSTDALRAHWVDFKKRHPELLIKMSGEDAMTHMHGPASCPRQGPRDYGCSSFMPP